MTWISDASKNVFAKRARRAPSWALTFAAALVAHAPFAAAQEPPATPVFEASGYGVLRSWFEFGRTGLLAVRPADSGGAAELTTFTQQPFAPRVNRWRVSPAGAPYFAGSIPLAQNATAALWADVDGDGASDLVVGEYGNGPVVEILLMGPGGLVTPGRTYPLPIPPLRYDLYYLTSADVNGDGRMDIGVVSGGDANGSTSGPAPMVWMLASGADSFVVVPGTDPYQRPTPLQFRAGDPIALVNWLAPSLCFTYCVGHGDGTFEPIDVPYPASGQPLASDFDHDGLTDFVAGRYLYRGGAAGLPTLLDSLSADVTALVDLDHDGVGDLVAVHDGAIRVARGGDGFTFAPFTETRLGNIDDQWLSSFGRSSVTDVNGDGWSDVVGTSYGPRRSVVYVAPGEPGGGFHQPPRLETAASPIQVELADVIGGDAKLDLLVLERGPNQLEVRPGAGDGTFGPPQTFALPAAPTRFAMADLDSDGRQDLVIACDSPPMVCVLPGTPTGFGAPVTTTVAVPIIDLQVGDVDADGHFDVIAGGARVALQYLRGLGGFAFEPADVHSSYGSVGHMRLADLDRDGHLDLIIQQDDVGPSQFVAELGDGHGMFGYGTGVRAFPVLDAQAWRNSPFETGDLLGDGNTWAAYVTTDSLGGVVYSYFRAVRFAGSTQESLPLHCDGSPCWDHRGYQLPAGPKQIAIADVTLDGIPDVLSLSDKTGTLTVLPGSGQGNFGIPSVHVLGPDPVSFALGDVNGDYKPDVVVADGQLGEVWTMRNLESSVAGVAPRWTAGTLGLRVLSAPNAAVVRLQVGMASDLSATVELFDTQGRRLARQRLDPAGGTQRDVIFEGGSLPRSGVLFARVTQAGSSATTRMLRFR